MIQGMGLKLGIFLLIALAVFVSIRTFGTIINSRINDYVTTKETLMAKQIEVAELNAKNEYLNQLAVISETFQQEKTELMESTNQSLLEARSELLKARNRWEVEDIRERASTPEGNADLTARAARATYRKKDKLEKLSNWDNVYALHVSSD